MEAHNSIGIVERYHGPVRRAYTIITDEIADIDKTMALQMTFKAINDSAGPDGLIPTLLVFGAYPRMSEHDAPTPTVSQRASAIKKAMAELQKIRAQHQVYGALNTRNGPGTTSIHGLTLNSDVLVWREGNTGQPGSWTGPYKIISIQDENCVVALPHGHTTFRSTVVKPYFSAPLQESSDEGAANAENNNDVSVTEGAQDEEQQSLPAGPVLRTERERRKPRRYENYANGPDVTVFLQDEHQHHQFKASRQAEITGLLEKGVFAIVTASQVPAGARIFNSRFVDEVKNQGTSKAFKKSRLVV